MADFPLGGGSESISIGEDTTTSSGAIVTASASADTKGAWVELDASTPQDVNSLIVVINKLTTVTNGNDILIDIAIGAAASEEVIIENVSVTYGADALFSGRSVYLPVKIPVGSRVSARCQSSLGSQACTVSIVGFVGAFTTTEGYSYAESLGVDLANTQATEFDPGAVTNAKGAWTEIEAALTDTYQGFSLLLSANQNSANTAQQGLLDIGIGSAGNEVVIAENVPYKISSGEFADVASGFFSITLPEGERLSVRGQSSTNNAGDRQAGLFVYGVK